MTVAELAEEKEKSDCKLSAVEGKVYHSGK